MTPLAAALEYARRGWPVLPMHTPQTNGRGPCSCGNPDCANAGKHPRVKQWPQKATTVPGQIEDWWKRWPDANVGIITGQRSHLLVLDIDPDKGGRESLAALERQHGPLPRTWTVETSGGGLHYYFLLPEGVSIPNSASALASGLDIRGDGGCAVAPPSRHKSGKQYVVADDSDPALCPEWLWRQLVPIDLKAIGEVLFPKQQLVPSPELGSSAEYKLAEAFANGLDARGRLQQFISAHSKQLRATAGRWHEWTGCVWAVDSKQRALNLARILCQEEEYERHPGSERKQADHPHSGSGDSSAQIG